MSKARTNRLFALALVLFVTLSLAIPALAATNDDGEQVPPYTITIVPNDNTAVPPDADEKRFEAYQIFAGVINEKSAVDDGYDGTIGEETDGNGYRNPNANQLSDVTWGNGIKSDKIGELLYALTQDATVNAENKLSAALTAAGYEIDGETKTVKLPEPNENDLSLDDTAAIVAKAISTDGDNNAALARAFAKVVSNYLSDTSVESDWDGEHDQWTIEVSKAGYYLIVDTHENKEDEENKAKSDFLVGVFGDSTVYVKSNVPTVDKTIVGADPAEGTDIEIGKPLTFQLKGTLPENFGAYDSYYYAFTDTLSAGLTYDSVLRVYAKVGIDHYLIDPDPMNGGEADNEATGEGYQLSASGTALKITFDDLKKLKGKKVVDSSADTWTTDDESVVISLTAASEIYVEYTAHLNEDAVITDANTNKVKLTYSNDPTWDGDGTEPTGDTPEEFVYVYNFGVNLYKYDAVKGATSGALEGAGFAVTKTVSNVKYYAIFADGEEDGEYVLAGWISESALGDLVEDTDDDEDWKAVATTGEGLTADKVADYLNEAYKDDEDGTYYLAIVTDEDGNLNFKGLEDSITYTLKEVITPEGYDSLPGDITVTYTAEYYRDDFADVIDGEIEEIRAQIEDLEEDEEGNADEISALEAQVAVLQTEKTTAAAGKLRSLTATVTGLDNTQASQTIVENGALVGTAYTAFAAQLNVPNTPAGFLPGTGGMGVYLFYIGGGLLLACGVVFLVLSNRKKKPQ